MHHGIWIPSSTVNINFYTYPGLMAHLVNLDDWAKTEMEIPKSEMGKILKGQQYRSTIITNNKYLVRNYKVISDSIINSKLPLTLELKSSRGDFLMFYAEEKTKDTVYLHLYTDWN